MTEKHMREVLETYHFELPFNLMKGLMTPLEFNAFVKWVAKYKTNIRGYKKAVAEQEKAGWIYNPWWLDGDDPRYDPDRDEDVLADDAPEEAKRVFRMMEEYKVFGEKIPYIEFVPDMGGLSM